MLHLIPRALHRAGYRAAHLLRTYWWRVAKPMMHGVCVMAQNSRGEWLLVRASYGARGWHFPGGGVGHGEDPCEAARREFAEETGLVLKDAQLLGQQVETLHGATNIVHVVQGRADGEVLPDGREIVAAGWFAHQTLPDDRSATVDRRLALHPSRLREGQ